MLTRIIINAQSDVLYNNIHNYFSNPRLQVEYIPYLLGTVIVLAALLFFGAKFLYWGIKRQAYIPRGTIKAQPNILLLLNKCINKRVKMDFQFDLEEAADPESVPGRVRAAAEAGRPFCLVILDVPREHD